MKVQNGNHLLQFASGIGTGWTETRNLELVRVTAQAVSAADQANGIAESFLVSISSEIFRNYDRRTGKWTEWYNGRNLILPPGIQVIRRTNGQWSAQASGLSSFVPFTAHGNPGLIPHGAKQALAAFPTPPPAIRLETQNTNAPSSPAATNAASKASDQMQDAVARIMATAFAIAFLVALLGITPSVIRYIYRKNKKSVSQPKGNMRPPRIPPPQPLAVPPPLPISLNSPEISIIEARSHLLTAAEQAFFAVLEPIVRSSCMISSKVRLADLFDVRKGRGQQAAFNKICSKHIDFVLTDPGTSRILCGIELDDSSHNRTDRIARDTFVNELFAAQGLPLLRVPVAWTYYPQALRAEFLKAGVAISHVA
ncbi:MAG: DUF2726 domain-containing protein [Luteolibacter sp.]